MNYTKENLKFIRALLSSFDEHSLADSVIEVAQDNGDLDDNDIPPEEWLQQTYQKVQDGDSDLITHWINWRAYLEYQVFGIKDDYWNSPYNDMYWSFMEANLIDVMGPIRENLLTGVYAEWDREEPGLEDYEIPCGDTDNYKPEEMKYPVTLRDTTDFKNWVLDTRKKKK